MVPESIYAGISDFQLYLCAEPYAGDPHYIPAALYPKGQKLEYGTRIGSGVVVEHMKAPLLCLDCEKRFDQNGESELLRHIAPKSVKRFSLHEKLRLALPREANASMLRFAGYDIGLDMDKCAYFTVSVVWRGAVHQWAFPDGNVGRPSSIFAGDRSPLSASGGIRRG
jgi:hypothetical protein